MVLRHGFILALVFLLCLAPALANLNCNPPASGDWSITNLNVICENNTWIAVSGLVNVTNSNVTFTNRTNLTATYLWIKDATSTLLFENSSYMNATLNLSNGNATFQNSGNLSGNFNMTGGILRFTNTTFSTAQIKANGTSQIYAENLSMHLNNTLTLQESASLNITLSSITFDNTLFAGTWAYNASTIFIEDSTYNGDIVPTCDNVVTLRNTNMTNGSTPRSIFVFSSCTDRSINVTLDNVNATHYSLSMSLADNVYINDSTFASTTFTYGTGTMNITAGNTNFLSLQVTFYNYSYQFDDFTNESNTFSTTIAETATTRGTFTTITSNQTYINAETGEVNITNANITIIGVDNATVRLTNANVGELDADPSGAGQTLYLTNVTLHDFDTMSATNSSTIEARNWTVTNAEFYGNYTITFLQINNIANITLGAASVTANLTMTGNVTFGEATPVSYSGTYNILRVYPFYLVNESGVPIASANVTVIASLASPGSYSWTGLTDANGYAEPNLTYTSSTYDDTFYLYLPGLGGQYNELTLLNDTPINWSVQGTGPFIVLTPTQGNVSSGTFGFNVSFSNDTNTSSYAIANSSGTTWSLNSSNATELNDSDYAFQYSFNSIYLPAGTWTLNVTADNGTVQRSVTHTYMSIPAMTTTLTSAGSQSATINGANATFTFALFIKSAGDTIKSYINLTNGAQEYNTGFARLSNGSVLVATTPETDYSNAGNVTLQGITSEPDYVTMNLVATGLVRAGNLTLILQPYSTLVPGTYTGSYGFGAFG